MYVKNWKVRFDEEEKSLYLAYIILKILENVCNGIRLYCVYEELWHTFFGEKQKMYARM